MAGPAHSSHGARLRRPIFGLWGNHCCRRSKPEGDSGGFYTFAAITRDPPPEVLAAGHERCTIPIRPENLDAWLDPDPKNLGAMHAILQDPIDAYYQHELVPKGDEKE